MAVDTRTIAERRTLRFHSLDEMVADAERLVQAPRVRLLGNWSLDQLLMHLATAINISIDGSSVRAPWYIRVFGPLLKRRVLTRGVPAGFRLPRVAESEFFPQAPSTAAALDALRQAVTRLASQTMTASHPVFGRLTHEEWQQLHLRHSELHLSFALPLEAE